MKKNYLFLISILLISAFVLGSCGSSEEKVKEKSEVECTHDLEKDHECDQATKDTCAHAKAEDHDCEHEHEHDDDCEHDHEKKEHEHDEDCEH